MSKTDKTRPYWVQFSDPHNRKWSEERHDHRNGVCDLGRNHPRNGWCNRFNCLWQPTRTADNSGLYMRCGRRCGHRDFEVERRFRMRFTVMRNAMLKTMIEDFENFEHADYYSWSSAAWWGY